MSHCGSHYFTLLPPSSKLSVKELKRVQHFPHGGELSYPVSFWYLCCLILVTQMKLMLFIHG